MAGYTMKGPLDAGRSAGGYGGENPNNPKPKSIPDPLGYNKTKGGSKKGSKKAYR